MEDNVPITVRKWEEEDEALADKQEELKGFWLLSPEKRERTVRLFWVSFFLFCNFLGHEVPICFAFLHRLQARQIAGGRAQCRISRVTTMLA